MTNPRVISSAWSEAARRVVSFPTPAPRGMSTRVRSMATVFRLKRRGPRHRLSGWRPAPACAVQVGDATDAAPTTQPVKHVRLLAVGNSFSGNATKYLPAIVAASGNKLTLGHASIGGCPLERHWRHAAAFEADPDDP